MITLSMLMLLAERNPARALLRWLARFGERLAQFHERRAAIRTLQELDDHMLKDIGMTRWRMEQTIHGGFASRADWR
jgi:uncharacterized protein YjiS (DUF1127 family)